MLLPPAVAGIDLNKRLIEGLMQEENAALHTFVANTLNAEAKKIM